MAEPTWDVLDTITLSTSAASIEFTGLDTLAADYDDVIFSLRGKTATNSRIRVVLNNDTSTLHRMQILQGVSSSLVARYSQTATDTFLSGDYNGFENIEGNIELQVFDIHDFNYNCRWLASSNSVGSDERTSLVAGSYGSTNAITRIKLEVSGSTFSAGTSAVLIGIKS